MKRVVVTTTPKSARLHMNSFDRCLYGVSVGSTNKPIEEILTGYRWAQANFKRCSILLGDSLYRFTLQIQQGCNSQEAVQLALKSGSAIAEKLISFLPRLPEIIRCGDVLANPRFEEYHNEIQKLYQNNTVFKSSIENDANTFVSRQASKDRLALTKSQSLDLAISYLIEEIAIYGCLAEQGWLVDVYLGKELPTLSKIITGDIVGTTDHLSKRVNISLRIK